MSDHQPRSAIQKAVVMKYLKLRVHSKVDGLVYEKDVAVQKTVEPFVRFLVSELVEKRMLLLTERYWVTLSPRYGGVRKTAPMVIEATSRSAPTKSYEMQIEESLEVDRPVEFFSLAIHLYDRNLICLHDVAAVEVATTYLAMGTAAVLRKLGLLRQGEVVRTELIACDDALARFDREHLPTLAQPGGAVVEILDETPVSSAWKTRDMTRYEKVQMVGRVGPDDLRIYLRRDAWSRLVEEAHRSGNVECGGMLVGAVFVHPEGGRPVVEITNLSVGTNLISTHSALRYTFESWQRHRAAMEEIRRQYKDRRVVGWYHTHLVDAAVTDAVTGIATRTKLFLSQDDLFLHGKFFPDEWYVAMVLDPDGNAGFFQWQGKSLVGCPGYFLFDDSPISQKDIP